MKEISRMMNGLAGGTHEDGVTRLSSGVIPQRHLLVAQKDGQHVVVVGAQDRPIGVVADTALEAGEPVYVRLLGIGSATVRFVAETPVAAGDRLYSAEGGRVQAAPGKAGTYYEVGTALHDAPPHALVEAVPAYPSQYEVKA